MIRNVLVIDDHPTSALIFGEIINELWPTARVLEKSSIDDLASDETALLADLVVSDLNIPPCNSEQTLQALEDHLGTTKVIIFSAAEDEATRELVRSKGYLFVHKSSRVRDIISDIQSEFHVDLISTKADTERNEYQSVIRIPGASKPLTLTQTRVMELISRGFTVKETAQSVELSPGTVQGHFNESCERLGASGKAEAVAFYLKAKALARRMFPEELEEELEGLYGAH